MYNYKIKASVDGKIKTIDHLNQSELENINNNYYINRFDNLIIIRNDGNTVEYIKQNNMFIVTNKIKQEGF